MRHGPPGSHWSIATERWCATPAQRIATPARRGSAALRFKAPASQCRRRTSLPLPHPPSTTYIFAACPPSPCGAPLRVLLRCGVGLPLISRSAGVLEPFRCVQRPSQFSSRLGAHGTVQGTHRGAHCIVPCRRPALCRCLTSCCTDAARSWMPSLPTLL